jgi:hypothetical protein
LSLAAFEDFYAGGGGRLFDDKQNGKNNGRKNKTTQTEIPERVFRNSHRILLM